MPTVLNTQAIPHTRSVRYTVADAGQRNVPIPSHKPIINAPLDNPIAVHTMQVFAQEYQRQTQKAPWHVLLHAKDGGVTGVRVKRADVERVFGDPQALVRARFGPQLKIAYTPDQKSVAHAASQASQLDAAKIRKGDTLSDLAQRMHQSVTTPVTESTLSGAHEVLGALIEASVHPHIHNVLRDLGHGDVPVTIASREALRAQTDPTQRILLTFHPVTFVDYIRAWTKPDTNDLFPKGQVQSQPKYELAVTAYLNTRSFTGGPINALLNPKDARLWIENRTREEAQRTNSATLLSTLNILRTGEADFAAASAAALTAYPKQPFTPRHRPFVKTR